MDRMIEVPVQMNRATEIIRIADWLLAHPPFLAWLEGLADPADEGLIPERYDVGWPGRRREALRQLVVGLVIDRLLHVWDAVDERNFSDDDRQFLAHPADLSYLDRVTGLPGFGQAMKSVGWAEEEDGDTISVYMWMTETPDARRCRTGTD